MNISLTSHNYGRHYPANAYVLWTFHYEVGQDTTDIVYQVSFGYISFGSSDFLRIGSGSQPNNSESSVTYGNHYYGSPNDFSLPAGDMFVEFDADSYGESGGFQLYIAVRNVSGMSSFHLHNVVVFINLMSNK